MSIYLDPTFGQVLVILLGLAIAIGVLVVLAWMIW